MPPIYAAPDATTERSVTLNPIDTLMVWFQQDISGSTLFSSARSMSTEIDLSLTNSATLLYRVASGRPHRERPVPDLKFSLP